MKKCFPNDPNLKSVGTRDNLAMSENLVYKITSLDPKEDESYFWKKLKGTNLIPKLIKIKDCLYGNEKKE